MKRVPLLPRHLWYTNERSSEEEENTLARDAADLTVLLPDAADAAFGNASAWHCEWIRSILDCRGLRRRGRGAAGAAAVARRARRRSSRARPRRQRGGGRRRDDRAARGAGLARARCPRQPRRAARRGASARLMTDADVPPELPAAAAAAAGRLAQGRPARPARGDGGARAPEALVGAAAAASRPRIIRRRRGLPAAAARGAAELAVWAVIGDEDGAPLRGARGDEPAERPLRRAPHAHATRSPGRRGREGEVFDSMMYAHHVEGSTDVNDVSGEGRVISPEAVISPERRDASRRSSVCFALRVAASSESRRAAASASAAVAVSAASSIPGTASGPETLACLAICEGRFGRGSPFSTVFGDVSPAPGDLIAGSWVPATPPGSRPSCWRTAHLQLTPSRRRRRQRSALQVGRMKSGLARGVRQVEVRGLILLPVDADADSAAQKLRTCATPTAMPIKGSAPSTSRAGWRWRSSFLWLRRADHAVLEGDGARAVRLVGRGAAAGGGVTADLHGAVRGRAVAGRGGRQPPTTCASARRSG